MWNGRLMCSLTEKPTGPQVDQIVMIFPGEETTYWKSKLIHWILGADPTPNNWQQNTKLSEKSAKDPEKEKGWNGHWNRWINHSFQSPIRRQVRWTVMMEKSDFYFHFRCWRRKDGGIDEIEGTNVTDWRGENWDRYEEERREIKSIEGREIESSSLYEMYPIILSCS